MKRLLVAYRSEWFESREQYHEQLLKQQTNSKYKLIQKQVNDDQFDPEYAQALHRAINAPHLSPTMNINKRNQRHHRSKL